MALSPPIGHAALLSLGWRDWRSCLDGTAPSWTQGLGHGLTTLTTPLVWIAFLPFAGLALLWFFRGGRLPVVFWLALTAALVAGHLPPGTTHHCDAKGLSSEFWPFVLALPAFLLSLVAVWITRPRPPTRPPANPPAKPPASPKPPTAA